MRLYGTPEKAVIRLQTVDPRGIVNFLPFRFHPVGHPYSANLPLFLQSFELTDSVGKRDILRGSVLLKDIYIIGLQSL
jgi:hypothetical protein